jgi:transketolase
MPNLAVYRPADAVETAECWQLALHDRTRPSLLALTRQNLPQVRHDHVQANLCGQGAYELSGADGAAAVSLFASGSEVGIAIEAKALLHSRGVSARVVSVPCFERFFEQDESYRTDVVGTAPVKVGIEAAVRQGWDAIIGVDGLFVGMAGFGASATYEDLYKHFGITAEAVVDQVLRRLEQAESGTRRRETGMRRRG